MDYKERIENICKAINTKIDYKPEIAIILGSGLGDLAEKIEEQIIIDYKDIKELPVSTVQGHKGRFIFGTLSGKKVMAMQGRFHYYEGYDIKDVVLPIRVMGELGVETIIVTNAAGGVNKEYKPGDLMIIEDHINYASINPLIGKNLDDRGDRFPDMSEAYTEKYIELVEKVAKDNKIDVKKGVYIWFTGPTYETKAEVRMARALGADAVGMSTVPEVIVARHEGINILGISCITNMASGILDQPLNHDEVVETSNKVKDKFESLILETIKRM